VADLVAHKSFKTPTACAGALVDAVRLYDDLLTGLRTALGERVHVVLDHAQQRQDHLSQRITQSASHAINRQSDRLKNLCQRLVITAPQRLDRCHDQLETQVLQLRALDPARVLARGWSITRTVDGRLITHVGDVSAADELITTLADGTVSSTVTAKEVSS
jgi:exodeoxyribonuclease VII large subunit